MISDRRCGTLNESLVTHFHLVLVSGLGSRTNTDVVRLVVVILHDRGRYEDLWFLLDMRDDIRFGDKVKVLQIEHKTFHTDEMDADEDDHGKDQQHVAAVLVVWPFALAVVTTSVIVGALPSVAILAIVVFVALLTIVVSFAFGVMTSVVFENRLVV